MEKTVVFFMYKLFLTAFLAVAIIAYRFFGLKLTTALWLQYYFGYWSLLIVLGWFGWSFQGELRPLFPRIGGFLRHHLAGIGLVLAAGVFLQIQEPHMFKVLQDEPSHMAASLLIHEQRVVGIPAESHIFDGALIYRNILPATRMFLFPTILTFLHDLTGYRVENVFILNGLLAALVLGLIYGFCYLLAGVRGGCLGVLIMAGFPLFAQNATSGGYDLLNLSLLLGLLLATRHYLLRPREGGLNLMLSVAVLLALSRYESILYLLIPIVAVLYKWRREGTVTLTGAAMISPLAVWPCFTANFIILSNDGFTLSNYREKGAGFFGIQYLADNARSAVYYLFNFDLDSTNSILISVLGSLGLITLWILLVVRFRSAQKLPFEPALLGIISFGVFILYVFVLTNFWGMPTQSSATRFILPLCSMMTLAAVWLVKEASKNKRLGWTPLVVTAVFMTTIANSSNAKHATTIQMSVPDNYKWFLDYARKHDDGRTLYVAPSSVYMLAYRYPAAPTSAFNSGITGSILCLQAKLYDEIIILDIRYRDPVSGKYSNGLGAPVSGKAQYDVVAERNFPNRQSVRILRIKPVLPPPDVVSGKYKEPPVLRDRFKSDQERSLYYYNLLP